MNYRKTLTFAIGVLATSVPVSATSLTQPGFTDQLVTVLGSPGNNFGSITGDSAGNVLITDRWNGNAAHIAAGTGVVTSFGSGLGTPLSLELIGTTLYVGNGSGQIYATDPVGLSTTTTLVGSVTGSAHGMTVAPSGFGAYGGHLIVSGNGRISAIHPVTGVATVIASPSGYITGVDFTPDGRLIATNYSASSLLEVSAAGTVTTLATGLSSPGGLSIRDDSGEIFVANEGSSGILRFDSLGTSQIVFASDVQWDRGHYPSMIGFSADGTSLYYGEVPAGDSNHAIREITGFSAFTTVPDGGSTALMLGLAFLGFGAAKRKLR